LEANAIQIKQVIERAIKAAGNTGPRGTVASYIPELGKAELKKAGISITLKTGKTISAGDAFELGTIQSASRVFTLALALGAIGDRFLSLSRSQPNNSFFCRLRITEDG